MKNVLKLLGSLFLLGLINNAIFAQTNFEAFPSDLTLSPFAANALEPKIGTVFQTTSNELRLDIGASRDLVRWNYENGSRLSIGADFFTYSLLRSEDNFHFPVDAIDYLFGLNAVYKIDKNYGSYGFRFRLSHISAHFVDGHYDGTNQRWRDGLNPRVYSREFIELTPFYQIENARVYAGFTYIFHIDPKTIKKDNYQFGFEKYFNGFMGNFISLYVAYDFKLIHLDKYTGNNSVEAGVKFGGVFGGGLRAYYNYYSGMSLHGQYFDKRIKYSAVGITIDF
ncbi:MAG: DUF1207 domain-containing protein [Chlorobi bacterium]|nr:DUF1207 domain-containing protein [Chlorobiota bacterium]